MPCRRVRRPRRVLRHGPAASCSASMALRVSVSGTPGDASPGPATASVAATVPASIKDRGSSRRPREPRKVSRGRRAAASGCHLQPIPSRPGASVSIRPCRLQCGDMAHPCRRGASPHAIRNTWRAGRVAPGRRQPQATAAAPVPDFHRPSVVQSVGRHLPTTWPRGHKWTASDYTRHQGGTKKRMLSSLAAAGRNADLAPRHYRDSAIATSVHDPPLDR